MMPQAVSGLQTRLDLSLHVEPSSPCWTKKHILKFTYPSKYKQFIN